MARRHSRSRSSRVSLIVTDWMMPHVDGIELCRRLKGDIATAGIPVIVLSAALPPHPEEPP
ncbi:response regulator [Paraburkholderia madseniana]|uniref:response regulator n=1 Tax=Paraburkholderia madseniana TaxID=2599607 RepID=UPI0022786937|nr:response regulator [Paraburkholderia madseniana]